MNNQIVVGSLGQNQFIGIKALFVVAGCANCIVCLCPRYTTTNTLSICFRHRAERGSSMLRCDDIPFTTARILSESSGDRQGMAGCIYHNSFRDLAEHTDIPSILHSNIDNLANGRERMLAKMLTTA